MAEAAAYKPLGARAWHRLVWALDALDRRVLRVPCDTCGDTRRCWKWHVEIMNCPTCGTTVDEFDPRFRPVFRARVSPPGIWVGTGTSTFANTVTLSGNVFIGGSSGSSAPTKPRTTAT